MNELRKLGFEKIAIIRASGGRLGMTGMLVRSEAADDIAARLQAAADSSGEDVELLRSDGDRLVRVTTSVPPGELDRIIANAHAEREL